MAWKVDTVKLSCKQNNFSKWCEISNGFEFTSGLIKTCSTITIDQCIV